MEAAAFVTGTAWNPRGFAPADSASEQRERPLRTARAVRVARALSALHGESERRGRSRWPLKLVVLAIIARCASELPPEFAREVALIGKAAFQGDFGQRFIRVHQGATRNAQPKLSQKFLRGEMEGGTELPFERAERHVRNGRELPIGDLVMEMGAHVGQRGPEAWGGVPRGCSRVRRPE